MNVLDSAAKYITECQPFFRKIDATGVLYYIDTQRIGLAMKRNDIAEVKRLLNTVVNSDKMEPDMLRIRNKYLQDFYERTADYEKAFYYQKRKQEVGRFHS